MTINNGASLVALPWDGIVGGVVAVHATGTIDIGNSGATMIHSNGLGFRGGIVENSTSSPNTIAKQPI
jgi:hypothetical protein